jgi:hypothetical protein
MTDETQKAENPLDAAEAQLREICEHHEQFQPPLDKSALGRMMVHVQNINRSVNESTRDHVNAAKRLTDFAMTLTRLSKNSVPTSGEAAQRIRSLADTLRSAGADLASGNTTTRENHSSPA